MKNMIRASAMAVLMPVAMLAAAPSMADTVYSSTGFNQLTSEGGDYFVDSGTNNLIGATFTLSQKTQITGVGGVFSAFGDGGSIFAEIFSGPLSSFRSATVLGSTTFTPPSNWSDFSTALSVTLNPGTYELVFGSGLFGTSGNQGFAAGMQGPASSLFQSVDGGATWNALTDSVRVTVTGNVVPLPATLPLLVSGLAAGFGALRRRREVSAA